MLKKLASVILLGLIFVHEVPKLGLSNYGFEPVPEWRAPGRLEEALTELYKRPIEEIKQVVRLAYQLGNPVGFPTALDILAIIGVESSFKPNARGFGGQGIMQINPRVHEVENLWDIEINMNFGVSLLKQYYSKAKSETLALLFYNMGPSGARAACQDFVPCSTPYSKKVRDLKRKFLEFIEDEGDK